MSKRTSEANKAIANAWITEQQLVKDGKGLETGRKNNKKIFWIEVKRMMIMGKLLKDTI